MKLNKLMDGSRTIAWPTSVPPMASAQMLPGKLLASKTSARMRVTATPHKEPVGAGFLLKHGGQ